MEPNCVVFQQDFGPNHYLGLSANFELTPKDINEGLDQMTEQIAFTTSLVLGNQNYESGMSAQLSEAKMRKEPGPAGR